jgi:hypothetical protein
MKPKVNEYIEITNHDEWIGIQKYLFNLGYKWCDNSQVIIPKDNYPYPDYILIEIDHTYLTNDLMFSYGHIPYSDSKIHKAYKFLRKEKLNKLIL